MPSSACRSVTSSPTEQPDTIQRCRHRCADIDMQTRRQRGPTRLRDAFTEAGGECPVGWALDKLRRAHMTSGVW